LNSVFERCRPVGNPGAAWCVSSFLIYSLLSPTKERLSVEKFSWQLTLRDAGAMHHDGMMQGEIALPEFFQGQYQMPHVPEQHFNTRQPFNGLDEQLQTRLGQVRCQKSSEVLAKNCMTQLKQALAKFGSDWRVRPFGSFANGLAAQDSDLDATCFKLGADGEQGLHAAAEFWWQLKPCLEKHPDFQVIEEVGTARIPILRLRYHGKLEVDLSCFNTEPLPNTQLLRAYVELSPAVCDLCVCVKLWSKSVGVSGAKDNYLSSYSWVLMVIYYMQVSPDCGLPCFPTWAFNGQIRPPQALQDVKWTPRQNLSQMLYGFFHFYAREFQWGEEVVAAHLGERTYRTDAVHADLRGHWIPRLHVADPFLLRNLNCVLGLQEESVLYSKICEAVSAMVVGQLPVGLTPDPALPPHRIPTEEIQHAAAPERLPGYDFQPTLVGSQQTVMAQPAYPPKQNYAGYVAAPPPPPAPLEAYEAPVVIQDTAKPFTPKAAIHPSVSASSRDPYDQRVIQADKSQSQKQPEARQVYREHHRPPSPRSVPQTSLLQGIWTL